MALLRFFRCFCCNRTSLPSWEPAIKRALRNREPPNPFSDHTAVKLAEYVTLRCHRCTSVEGLRERHGLLTVSHSYLFPPGRSQRGLLSSPRPLPHLRSLSSVPASSTARKAALRSSSTSALPHMATVTNAPGLPSRSHHDTETLATLPDPRSPGASPSLSRTNSPSPHHPDLNSEVATLSNKLISAINHQTNLDDTLAATRHELDAARARVKQLEAATQEHEKLLARGILVKKTDVDQETMKLMSRLADEKKQRSVAEKDKKGIELELETLTSALFEEANQVRKIIRGSWSCLTRSRWLLQHGKNARLPSAEMRRFEHNSTTPNFYSHHIKSSLRNSRRSCSRCPWIVMTTRATPTSPRLPPPRRCRTTIISHGSSRPSMYRPLRLDTMIFHLHPRRALRISYIRSSEPICKITTTSTRCCKYRGTQHHRAESPAALTVA